MDAKFVTALLFVMCLHLVSPKAAAAAEAEMSYDNGKLFVPKMSKKEIQELRKEAESLPTGAIPDNMQGGVWFDGKMEEALSNDEFGQPSWLVAVDHIFLGQDQISAPRIKIRSATAKLGGCSLRVGTEYRIFAVNLNQLLGGGPDDPYAWRGSAVPLSRLKQISHLPNNPKSGACN